MIIIGVDPGTIVCGYGVIETDGTTHRALDYGCIRPPRTLELPERYLLLFNSLDELLSRYKPKALAVETQYVNKNPQSAIKLGMARGTVIVAAGRKKISIAEYSPAKAKLAVVGNGRASKGQVQAMVQRLLNLATPPSPEDAADALALAICHAQSIKEF